MTTLEVLICTIGQGIAAINPSRLPQLPGVSYLIAWQVPSGETPELIPASLHRPDIRILTHTTRGLTVNRNFALANASAPLLLIADDDVDYSPEGLQQLIEAFKADLSTDIILCRYLRCGKLPKPYPSQIVEFRNAPRGYYATSFEIALRRESVKRLHLRFDTYFGIGSGRYICGEEDIFIHEALKKGAVIKIHPIVIGSHDHPTTAARLSHDPEFHRAHAAVMRRLRPWSWPLRLLVHASRQARPLSPGWFRILRNYLRP